MPKRQFKMQDHLLGLPVNEFALGYLSNIFSDRRWDMRANPNYVAIYNQQHAMYYLRQHIAWTLSANNTDEEFKAMKLAHYTPELEREMRDQLPVCPWKLYPVSKELIELHINAREQCGWAQRLHVLPEETRRHYLEQMRDGFAEWAHATQAYLDHYGKHLREHPKKCLQGMIEIGLDRAAAIDKSLPEAPAIVERVR